MPVPTIPEAGNGVSGQELQSMADLDRGGPHRLWGEWTIYINDKHDEVVVVPKRESRFHLNTLKFLESYCSNCLQIAGFSNNSDGTFNLTVKITHPFPGHPEYTGFDVKGIMMFNGSDVFLTKPKYPMYPEYRVSSRFLGDPEVIDPDGYSFRWSPWYDSGSGLPIMNYWEGKFAHGTPTANLNAFLNFYSTEERHAFYSSSSVSRTYHLSLPSGPITAGYAVEACWEPPSNTPVSNPLIDFPITANMPDPYRFKIVVNDGNPITDPLCCGDAVDLHSMRAEISRWYVPEEAGTYGEKFIRIAFWTMEQWGTAFENGTSYHHIEGDPEGWYPIHHLWADAHEEGWHKGIGVFGYVDIMGDPQGPHLFQEVTVFEFYVDLE
jgi:hypothetical protein